MEHTLLRRSINKQHILNDLIVVSSITGDGVSCRKIIKVAQGILATAHVPNKVVKITKRSILIWGELNLEKSEWLINSHLDVVPGSLDQFVPQTKGGKVWGRGAADTKSSCAIMLANAANWESLARVKHLTFMLVTDEEIGGESTKTILKQMPSLQGSIFLEPTGEKMIVHAKGIIQLKITANGKASHGSRPWDGENALEKITSCLTTFRIHHPSPLQETRATSFNFSLISSGTAINQVPVEAILWCDIRWSPVDDPDRIVANMAHEFHGCKVEVVKLESPIKCPLDSELHQSFTFSLKANDLNPINGFEHGSSDARHATALGIPAIVFGSKGKNLHGDNEWVSLKSLEKVQAVVDHWIKNI